MSKPNPHERLAARLARDAAKTARKEAREDARARKERTRRLIEVGGLADKAGISGWPPEQLLGAFDAAKSAAAADEQKLARWAAAGKKLLNPPKPLPAPAVEVRFPGPLSKSQTQPLRELGLRFNRNRLVWEGRCDLASARALASKFGGEAMPIDAQPGTGSSKP